jgi:Zn finger protein HypA/HybF involved in hydrogenase expression
LKRHYKNKPVEYEENFNKRTEKLRCPTCHIKSFEINDDDNKPVKGPRNAA